MKRLKDYINKHPKLKRIAKLLGVIAIILSFLFNALIIGSLIINANKPNDNKVLAYGDYQPKMANNDVNTSNHDITYIAFGDFGDSNIIKSLVYQTCYYANRLTSYENGLNDLASNANGSIKVSDYNITQNTIYYGSIGSQSLTSILEAYLEITNSTNPNFRTLTFWVAIAHNTGGYFRFNIEFNPLDFTEYNYTISSYTFTDYTITTYGNNIDTSHGYFVMDMTDNNSNIGNILFNWNYYDDINSTKSFNLGYDQGYSHGEIVGKAEGIEEGYASGYDAGLHENDAYGLGYTDGYNTGETAGYNQGYSEGSTGMSSNPFKLIANAFDAVASILNIQVLPNLTLGVLVFTPVIVIIILVVVKFIRG